MTRKPIRFSRRTQAFEESVIREMTRLGDETGAINLSQGLPDFDTPQVILEAAANAVRSGFNQYSFPFGDAGLRSAISAKTSSYNKIKADPELEITVTCGVSEAIVASIFALTEPGDEVILFEPWYENYLPACHLAGVIPSYVRLNEPDFLFDPRELKSAFTTKTRLIIINSPHNPTGKVFSRTELEIIGKYCQEYGVLALTDEIYEHILYEDNHHVSIGSLPGMEDRTITISGLGKTFALTGWRIGWAVAPPGITSLIRKVHDYLTICAPAPLQAAAVAALTLPSGFYPEMNAVYDRRRKILLEFLSAKGMNFFPPQGAYYVIVNFENVDWHVPTLRNDNAALDLAFAEYMATEIGVAVVPASCFYTRSKNLIQSVRINFARHPDTLRAAISRLQNLILKP